MRTLLAALMSAPCLRRPGIRTLSVHGLKSDDPAAIRCASAARAPANSVTRYGNGAQRGPRPGAALRP
eukprot:3391102-Prymnesium_polylepis.1